MLRGTKGYRPSTEKSLGGVTPSFTDLSQRTQNPEVVDSQWSLADIPAALSFYFLFIYFWLCWVFVAACAFFSLLQGVEASRCSGFSFCSDSGVLGLHCLWHLGSVVVVSGLQSTSSVVAAHGFSCSMVRGVLPDQGLKPCLLHWQVDSLPLSHQGSPAIKVSSQNC